MYQDVAVIGAGTMGNGIAHVFAQSGYHVNLIDVNTEALDLALATIAANLDRQIKKEIITADQRNRILSRINRVDSIALGVQDRQLVV
ncbi:MAG: 3-hydroxyacyl-CoA dehydrogenase NAD-binding domain-containing protein, partial [Sphingobacteriia bacterium]